MRDIAIRNVYNNVVTIDAGIYAYDKDGNSVEIDETLISEEISKLAFGAVKKAKLTEVTETYNASNQNNIAYMDATFQADYKSQDTLSKVLVAGAVPPDFYWLDITNTKVPMIYAQLQGLAVLLLERNQVNFNNLQAQRVAINKATTVSQVQSL